MIARLPVGARPGQKSAETFLFTSLLFALVWFADVVKHREPYAATHLCIRNLPELQVRQTKEIDLALETKWKCMYFDPYEKISFT